MTAELRDLLSAQRRGRAQARGNTLLARQASHAGGDQGRFVGGQQSVLAGCKPPPLFMHGPSSCSSHGRHQWEPWGASPRPTAPIYLPTSCSSVCTLGLLCFVCGILGHLAPVYRCARSVRSVPYAVSWATWLLFTGVLARCVVLRVRCPGSRGSCSPVCSPGVLCCVCGVLDQLSSVHRCARSVCCAVCAVSWATSLLFSGVYAPCVVLVCGVLGHLAPVHQCARLVCCAARAVSWATWLLFTGAHAPCVVLCVRCSGPLGSCPPVRTSCVLCCVRGVLGHLAPVHWCACSACCVGCAVSWATWLLLTGALARCVLLCVVCAVSWATWLLFRGVRAGCAVLRVPGVAAGRALVHPDGDFS